MKYNYRNILFVIAGIIFGFTTVFIFAEDESSAETDLLSDEYLAFELYFMGTLQQQYEMLEDQQEPKTFYDEERAVLDYRYKSLSIYLDGSMINDEIYTPSETYMLGRYLFINDANVSYDTENFSFKAGRTTQKDIVDTPYSIFVNSEPIPAPQVELQYKGDTFFYITRWVELNNNSDQYYFGSGEDSVYYYDDEGNPTEYAEEYEDGIQWIDRGFNYKVWGLNLGDWRFGMEEGAVYMYESFNPEFFFSPMIMYVTQLVTGDGAKPWTEYANSKHVLGFFADRTTSESYISSQFLLDDINASALPGISVENQTRVAWSLGGYKEFDFGRLGFYHAGATKDTFGATSAHDPDTKDLDEYDTDQLPLYYSSRPYPYTYYPSVMYELEDEDGNVIATMPIDYKYNYIGYKYGENNISFMVDYKNGFFHQTAKEFFLYSTFEWVLNGAKSPANPWHEYYKWKDIEDPVALLGGTVEHLLIFSNRIDKKIKIFGVPFSLFADISMGIAINAMGLEAASTDGDRESTEPWIYRPQEGVNESILSVTLGAGYIWRLK